MLACLMLREKTVVGCGLGSMHVVAGGVELAWKLVAADSRGWWVAGSPGSSGQCVTVPQSSLLAVAGIRRAWGIVWHSAGPSLESGLRLRRRFGAALTLLEKLVWSLGLVWPQTVPGSRT